MLRSDNYAYGLDAELSKKFAEKYDPAKARAVQTWIEALTGEKLTGNLQKDLMSGVTLCKAINKISPGTVSKINTNNMPFLQRENIAAYLSGCRKLGMRETDLFVTQDLYEGDNIVVVIDNLCSLGLIAKNLKGYNGPLLVVSGGKVEAPRAAEQKSASAAPVVRPSPVQHPTPPSRPAPSAAPASVGNAASAGGVPKFCSECGKSRSAVAKFCAECGHKF